MEYIREIPLDEIPPEEIFKDPDIVIHTSTPHEIIYECSGQKPSDHLKRIKILHCDVLPVECNGEISVKVLSGGLNIGFYRCRGCNQRLLIDSEELAINPFIENLATNL